MEKNNHIPTAKMEINRFTLSFSGDQKHLEKPFLSDYFHKYLGHMRLCHLLAIFFYGIVGILDAGSFPEQKYSLWFIRYLVVIPVFLIGLMFSFSSYYERFWQEISIGYIIITGGGFIAMIVITPPPSNYSYYIGVFFSMVFGYTFIRERFINASLAGWALFWLYFLVSTLIVNTPSHVLFHNSFYILLMNFLGMLIAYSIEFSARRDFFLGYLLKEEEEKIQEINIELEGKVQERTIQLSKSNEELKLEVAERMKAEATLRESERLYRFLADNVDDTIWTMDMEMKFTYFSPSVTRMRGYSVEEAMAQSIEESMPPASLDIALKAITEELEQHNKGQKPQDRSKKVEVELYCKDGSTVWTEIDANFIYKADGQPQGIIGVIRDITERRQAEKTLRESKEKLVRSKKMESLGLLAGGVAHDLNNVLSGIVSYPELILMDLPEDSKFRKPIETIRESGHRAAEIVQDLLTVARGVATTKEPLNLNDLVGDYLHSPEFNKLKQFHPTVKVKTKLDTGLFNISGSQVHIRKVVMNLVSNAAEAIKGSGNVTISTTNRYVDRPLRGYDDVDIGEYAILSVSDDGSGISLDDLERIFEPFYTKKVMGRSGTGLGLAVVWNTVQDHRGYIDVTSDENSTTFELYFPITRGEILDKDLSRPIKDYQGNQETILVVDDEESQREISCKMLDKLGYKTKAVSSGEEAVEYLKRHTVDLILLDMIMDPGINGRETYERIIKIHPKQKAIIVSGFAQTDEVRKAQKLGAGQYIKKPVTLEKIGIAVKEELEK